MVYRFYKKARKMGAEIMAALGSQILGLALGDATRKYNDERQLEQQDKLNEQQMIYNEEQAKYGAELGLQMWKDTNYPAQVKMLEKAGLNPALIYKQGGNGGTTSVPSVSNLNAPHAPAGGGELGLGMQLGLQAQMVMAQTKLAEAEANKANAEAKNIGGVVVEETESRITLNKQLAENAKVQRAFTEAETNFKNIQSNIMSKQADELVRQVALNNEKLAKEIALAGNELKISDATYGETIRQLQLKTVEQELEIAAKKAGIDLTKAEEQKTLKETTAITTQLVQKWSELSLKQQEIELDALRTQFNTGTWGKVGIVTGALKDIVIGGAAVGAASKYKGSESGTNVGGYKYIIN